MCPPVALGGKWYHQHLTHWIRKAGMPNGKISWCPLFYLTLQCFTKSSKQPHITLSLCPPFQMAQGWQSTLSKTQLGSSYFFYQNLPQIPPHCLQNQSLVLNPAFTVFHHLTPNSSFGLIYNFSPLWKINLLALLQKWHCLHGLAHNVHILYSPRETFSPFFHFSKSTHSKTQLKVYFHIIFHNHPSTEDLCSPFSW